MATKKQTKTEVARDAWGSRQGSISHDINATLISARAPKTVAQIAEESGASTTRVRLHMRWLANRDRIEKVGDGQWQRVGLAKPKRTTRKRTRKARK